MWCYTLAWFPWHLFFVWHLVHSLSYCQAYDLNVNRKGFKSTQHFFLLARNNLLVIRFYGVWIQISERKSFIAYLIVNLDKIEFFAAVYFQHILIRLLFEIQLNIFCTSICCVMSSEKKIHYVVAFLVWLVTDFIVIRSFCYFFMV